ncbi:unnamed protein product [Ectocarpus sp. 12 AP-2014]
MQTGWLVIEEDAEVALEDETVDRCIISCHGSKVLDEAGVREVEGGIKTPSKSTQLQMRANGATPFISPRFYSVVPPRRSFVPGKPVVGSSEYPSAGRPIGNPRGQFSSSIFFGHDGVCEMS